MPLAVLGALIGLWVTGGTLNLFSQIGIVMLIGLAAKNGILIVEFANQLRDDGRTVREAIIESSSLRLRPIIMTSLAFTLGVVPLMLASGASAETQRAIGTGVLGGMIVGTFLGIFFVPLFFVVIEKLINARKPHPAGKTQETPNA